MQARTDKIIDLNVTEFLHGGPVVRAKPTGVRAPMRDSYRVITPPVTKLGQVTQMLQYPVEALNAQWCTPLSTILHRKKLQRDVKIGDKSIL